MGANVQARQPIAQDRGRSRRSQKHVRYHVHVATQTDPSIQAEHRAAAGAPVHPSGAGLRNMENIIALYKTECRLPSYQGPSPGERAQAVWLQQRRRQTSTGAPSPPMYLESLKAIPGWDQEPGRKAKDDALGVSAWPS